MQTARESGPSRPSWRPADIAREGLRVAGKPVGERIRAQVSKGWRYLLAAVGGLPGGVAA